MTQGVQSEKYRPSSCTKPQHAPGINPALQRREDQKNPQRLGDAVQADSPRDELGLEAYAAEGDGSVEKDGVDGCVGKCEYGDVFVYEEDAGDAGVFNKGPGGHWGVV